MKREVALPWKLTMAFLVLLLLAAACAPAAAPTPTAVPAVPTAAPRVSPTAAAPSTPTPEKPKYGGVLTMGLVADPPSLDPNAETTGNINDPARAAYDVLVARNPYDPAMPFAPRLAERWNISGDGLTFTYQLRKDVKFHDGTPLRASDIKFTADRYRKPPEGVRSTQITSLEPIDSIEAPDDYTLVLHMKRSFVPMVSRSHGLRAYSKTWLEAGKDPRKDMMGTGPFKFKSFTPGISVEFVKSEDFWQPGKPYLDGVTYFVIKDPGTRFAALRTGQVKVMGNYFSAIPPADKETLEKERSPIRLWPMQTQLYPWLIFRITDKPWSDVRVRRAVNLATDRWQAIDVVFLGAARIGTSLTYRDPGGIPYQELITLPGFRKDKTADLAEAKRLLAEAGYPNGFDLKITTRTIKSFQDQALYMADQMSKLGIKATLEIVEDSALFPRGRRGEFSAMQLNLTGETGSDPFDGAGTYDKGGSLNFMPYESEDWLKQLGAMGSELDPVKRQKMVYDIDKRIHLDDVPSVFMVWFFNFNAAWPDVRNYPERTPDNMLGILENVWLR